MRRLFVAAFVTVSSVSAFARPAIPAWFRVAATTVVGTQPENTTAVVLLDEKLTTISDSGEIRTTHRRAYRILTTAGREYATLGVATDSETRLRSIAGFTIKPNGTELSVGSGEVVEAAPFDGGELYADLRTKMLEIPGAEPGSTVGFEYEQLERPYTLQSTWAYQESVPLLEGRYVLTLPPKWNLETRWVNAAAQEPVSVSPITWVVKNVPAIRDEPGMPDKRAVAARLCVNFLPPAQQSSPRVHQTWSDVGRWYTGLAMTRLTPSPGLTAMTRDLAKSKQTPIEKVAAIASFVQDSVRYVAIEIGIGGYKPHAAADVFANRYGDCKDKVTLLRTMLHEIGVESSYVLVNTERGVVEKDFATVGAFDHVIIAIRLPDAQKNKSFYATVKDARLGTVLLFDPTNASTPFGELPPYLEDSRGLLVLDDGGDLIDIPHHPPESSRLDRTAQFRLDSKGALEGTVREVRTGAIAAQYRSMLRSISETERTKFVEHSVAQHIGQASVRNVVFENLNDTHADLVVHYDLDVMSYANRAAAMVLVRPRVLGRKAETILDLKQRKFPYVTQGPAVETDAIDIVLPNGVKVDELPAAVDLDIPVLKYASHSTVEGQNLKYRREYTVKSFTVPVDSLAELNRAFTKILADERNAAVLVASN